MKHPVVLFGLLLSASAFAGLFGTDVQVPAVTVPAAPVTPAATATKSVTDLTQVASTLVESAKSLLSNPQLTDGMKAELTKFTDGVLANKDGVAAEALNKFAALKPNDAQMGLVKELQANFSVLALGRDFDAKDAATSGAVTQTIAALKAKDTAGIVTGLQRLGSTGKLTDAQQQVVTNLLGSYGGKLSGAVDKVNAASAKLKSFGL